VKASGNIGRETVITLAKRYGALAAINGGFWELNGIPSGILKINRCWYGNSIKPKAAIGWSLNGRKVVIDRVLTTYHPIDCDKSLEIKVIPSSNSLYTVPEEWKELEHIVGGTPILVKNGNVIEEHSSEQALASFLINKHPRTAVGIRENGEWVFVVVDGRFYKFFGGMTIKELAALMLRLGCSEALNLDGGGSSTMVLEGAVVNEPCGMIQEGSKCVQAVSDAILIFPYPFDKEALGAVKKEGYCAAG
jgi:exopolysaccharide biosynthesis protein